MQKYPAFDEFKLFQFLLCNSDELNNRYHRRARTIAYGLQPWIDASEISLAS